MNFTCPVGNSFCQTLYCEHWSLVGFCGMACKMRYVDEEKEDLKLKVATITRELADARKTIVFSVLVVDKLNQEVELLKEDAAGWCAICGKKVSRNWIKHLATHKGTFVGHVTSKMLKHRKNK